MLPLQPGFILQADGSAYNSTIPADVSEAITEDYIPLDFARNEIQKVVDDFKASNANYEKYIEELKDHIVLTEKTHRDHYMGIINELKSKGKEQVAFFRKMKKESDEYHQKEISEQEETIEDLRDLLAQSKIDKSYTDKKIDLLETKAACSKVVYDVVLRIEQDDLSMTLHNRHSMSIKQLQDISEAKVQKSVQDAVSKAKQADYEETKKTIEPLIKQLKDQLVAERKKVKQLTEELEDATDELEDLYDDLEKDGYKIKFEDDDSSGDDENSDEDSVGSMRSKSKVKRKVSIISPQGRRTSIAALKRAPSTLQDIHELDQEDKRVEEEKEVKLIPDLQANSAATEQGVAVDSALKQQNAAPEEIVSFPNTTKTEELAVELKEVQDRCADLQAKLEQSDQLVEDLKAEMQTIQHSIGVNPMQLNVDNTETSTNQGKDTMDSASTNPMSTLTLVGLAGGTSPKKTDEEVADNNELLQKVRELEQLLEETRLKMEEQELNFQKQLQQHPNFSSSSAIDELKKLIASKNKDLLEAEASFQSATSARKHVKETITTWIADFQAEHGREPTKEDKENIRDRFKELKIETTAVSAAKDGVDKLNRELEELNKRLGELSAAPEAPKPQEIVKVDMECQTDLPLEIEQKEEASPMVTEETTPADDEMRQRINELEETLKREQEKIAEMQEEIDKKEKIIIDVEEAFTEKEEELKSIQTQENALEELKEQHGIEVSALREQIDSLIAHKRTDVVKTLTDENKRLTDEVSANAIFIAELKVESEKNKAKVDELKDRAMAAEAEIKLREEADKAGTGDEATDKMKAQIKKQRQEIMSKTAAATSGWNAAADADEKLTIEVEKAYRRGCDETKKNLEQDTSDLHAALEVKEDKITELLLDVTNYQKEKRTIEENMSKLQSEMDELKLYLSDIEDEQRAAAENGEGSSGNGGTIVSTGGGIGVAHMQADLDKAMEQLDESHEELVELKEKFEHNQKLLEIANEKVAVYKRAISGKTSKSGDSDSALSTEDKDYCMQLITKSIKDGTLLWKQNKKEQCYDLYLDTCKHIERKVTHEESLKAIMSPAIASSAIPEKVSNTIAGLKKSKAAVVLRSALEKFVAAIKGSSQAASGVSPVILASLKKELESLKEKELDIGVHVEEEEEQEEQEVLIIGEDAMEDEPNSGHQITEKQKPALEDAKASSLLKRAKAAEKEVHELRLKLKDATAKKFANLNLAPSSTKTDKKEVTVASKRSEEIKIRRLTRQVEMLEIQLKGARRGAGGLTRGGGTQGRANIEAEKEVKKQMKEMEAAAKREKLAFEKQLREKDKAYKELQKEKQENEGNQAEVFERAKLAGKLQEEVTELREKAVELVTTTKELEELKETHIMVNEQLKKESTLRKKYKNDLEDLKGNIRVYARCRPFATYEKEKHCEKVVTFIEDTGIKVQTSRGEKEYEFDQVFNMESTQEAVFEDTRRLVESFLDGFNVCLFAYGQTGSGKTHTMTGNPMMPGLTPRAIDEMFKVMGERHQCQFKITSSFMELYNNQLVDLFWILDHPHKNKEKPPALEIRQDSKGIIFVQGAVIKDIESSGDLMTLFNSGNEKRHVGATKMNAESSRSHSVFCIMVESYDTSTKKTTFGKLSLVDLAGSERQDKTGATGERLQEAKAINQSLSALGNVISALTEGRKPPYKDNTLTKLMQDSLGGNAKTLMFVNFSPADYNSDETVSSLNYAARVKKIVNTGAKQEENEEVTRLKAQVKSLQAKLKGEDGAIQEEDDTRGGGAKVDG